MAVAILVYVLIAPRPYFIADQNVVTWLNVTDSLALIHFGYCLTQNAFSGPRAKRAGHPRRDELLGKYETTLESSRPLRKHSLFGDALGTGRNDRGSGKDAFVFCEELIP